LRATDLPATKIFRLQESGYRAARDVGIYDFEGVVPVQPEHLPQQQAGDSLSAVLPLHIVPQGKQFEMIRKI